MGRRSYLAKLCVAIGLIGLLTGCGSGASPSGTASGSANGTAAASGTITEFGSVIVNETRFETNGATFIMDDQPGSQSDLKLGMTVVVSGSFHGTQRSASTVRQKDAVEGPGRTSMERSDGGVWTATIPLKPGRYQYMFVIDGKRWIADPLATEDAGDGFGSRNAVLDVSI
jgi:hypothetical protein